MSKFMSELDHHSAKLSRVCLKKRGVAGRKIAEIMASINEVCDYFFVECFRFADFTLETTFEMSFRQMSESGYNELQA